MSTLDVLKNNSESSSKMTLKSQKLLAGALALVLVAGMITPAFALTIDNFSKPDAGAVDIVADDGTNHATTADLLEGALGAPSDTIGDYRYTFIEYQGGTGDVMAELVEGVEQMVFSSDGSSHGDFLLVYDANDGAGDGLDVDLEALGCEEIFIDLEFADADVTTLVRVTDNSGNTAEGTDTTVGPGSDTLVYPLAAMSNAGSTDFTDVNNIEVFIDGPIALDYIIDLIGCPQKKVGGTVGSMSTTTLLVAGAQNNMGLWSLALVGIVGAAATITYKAKSKKSEQ